MWKMALILLFVCVVNAQVITHISGAGIAEGGGGYDPETDSDCVSLYYFEYGDVFTDEKGNNGLTTNFFDSSNVTYKQGSAGGYCEANEYAYRADENLSADFPCKNGTENKTFTIGCWFRPTTAENGSQYFFSKYNYAANQRCFALRLNGSGQLEILLGYNSGASYETIGLDSVCVDATWYYSIASYDNSDKSYVLRIYRDNGTLIQGISGTATLDGNKLYAGTSDFLIGLEETGGLPFVGYIDYAIVTKDVLSTGEMDNLASY